MNAQRLKAAMLLRQCDWLAAQLRLVLYDRYGYIYKPATGGSDVC